MSNNTTIAKRIQVVEEDGDDQEDGNAQEEEEGNNCMNVSIDLNVLTCTSCTSRLQQPIYQCTKGHTLCSYCYSKSNTLQHKCDVSHVRCFFLEKIIQSIRVPCPHASFGCKQMIPYCKLFIHKINCSFLPIDCPLPDCKVKSALNLLPDHLIQYHGIKPNKLTSGNSFSLYFDRWQNFLALSGMDDILFLLLNNSVTMDSMALYLVCVLHSYAGRQFYYKLKASCCEGQHSLILESTVLFLDQIGVDDTSALPCLIIPWDFIELHDPSLSIDIKEEKIF